MRSCKPSQWEDCARTLWLYEFGISYTSRFHLSWSWARRRIMHNQRKKRSCNLYEPSGKRHWGVRRWCCVETLSRDGWRLVGFHVHLKKWCLGPSIVKGIKGKCWWCGLSNWYLLLTSVTYFTVQIAESKATNETGKENDKVKEQAELWKLVNLKLRGRNRGEVGKDHFASNLQFLTNESRNKPSDVEIFGDVLMAGAILNKWWVDFGGV